MVSGGGVVGCVGLDGFGVIVECELDLEAG